MGPRRVELVGRAGVDEGGAGVVFPDAARRPDRASEPRRPGGSWLCGTFEATGQSRLNVYTQTARHEVAVAAVSAQYIAAGLRWQRDDKPPFAGGHQADGVAFGRRRIELTEVELTPKRSRRYASIFTAFCRRLDYGYANRVAYLCNDSSARAVRVALTDSVDGRRIAAQVSARSVFGHRAEIRECEQRIVF